MQLAMRGQRVMVLERQLLWAGGKTGGAAPVGAAGGAVALVTHLAKATTRLAVNTSPEPASNVVVSVAEDIAVAGVVVIAVVNPWVAAAIALALLVGAVIVAVLLVRAGRSVFRWRAQTVGGRKMRE